MTTVSYAQNYEDVMLLRALREVEHGFYIDVGAQDPIDDSVTKAFYEIGWRGINIEPVAYWYQRLASDRPHDINLQLAVSDRPGRLHIYEVEGSGLSTTDANFATRHAQEGRSIRESDVQCVTLDWICSCYDVKTIHFLKIDCEGAEAAALRGLSLEHIRPWVILLEATEPNSQVPAYADWEPLLTKCRYRFAYADGLNRFYVAEEHDNLLTSFQYPPNVFDRFVRADQAVAHRRLQEVQSQLEVVNGAYRVGQLEERVIHLNTEIVRLNTEIARQNDEIVHLHSENEYRETELVARKQHAEAVEMALSAANDMLLGERNELKVAREQLEIHGHERIRSSSERMLLDEEIGRLRVEMSAVYNSRSWKVTAPLRAAGRSTRHFFRLCYRFAYASLRYLMRAARPLLRRGAKWKWLRTLILSVVGRDSKLASHGRIFLFGPPPLPMQPIASEASLTHQAIQVLSVIDKVRKSAQSNNTSKTPGEE